MRQAQSPILLLITPGDYETSVSKGVLALMCEHVEGFFEHVFTIHYLKKRYRRITLDKRNTCIEFRRSFSWRPLMILAAPWDLLKTIVALARLVRIENITIIRATDPCFSGLIALIVASVTHLPWCVSIHADFSMRHRLDPHRGAPRLFGSRSLARIIEHMVLSHADLVLPIRESLVPWANASGAPLSRICVIPHGIDMSWLAQPPDPDLFRSLGIDSTKKIVSFAGRFSPENYIEDIIAAAISIVTIRDDVVVLLAGDGTNRPELERRAIALSARAKAIRFLGFVPRGRCLDIRRISTVSLCLMGGFSLIEACAAGRPVISYDVEWHSELIVPGKTGFLLPEHALDAVVQSIILLLDDKELADRMGQAGRERAVARHDIRNTSEIKRRCYRALLGSGGSDGSNNV